MKQSPTPRSMISKHTLTTDQFPVKPICELCGAEPANNFASLGFRDGNYSDWEFCGACDDSQERFVMIDDIFDSPGSTTEELAVLHQAGTDWQSFMDMMVRFQAATQSFDI